jgi:hypothetical protein
MITITRTRIFVSASVLSVSALIGGVAAVAVASPANRYDTGRPAAQLTNMHQGARYASSHDGVQLTAVTQGTPATFYDH